MPKHQMRSDGGYIVDLGSDRLTVRALAPEHADALRHFDDSLSDESKRLFLPHAYDADTIRDYIQRSVDGDDASFVAIAEDRSIVAYFFLWEAASAVPLLGIGIADRFQGRGLGRKLMHILIETARGLGRSGIDLTTMMDNERAFHLYESCGFVYIGDVPNISGDGSTVIERRMFLAMADGATPSDRSFGPPDQISHG